VDAVIMKAVGRGRDVEEWVEVKWKSNQSHIFLKKDLLHFCTT
jgi:hypothetical protein